MSTNIVTVKVESEDCTVAVIKDEPSNDWDTETNVTTAVASTFTCTMCDKELDTKFEWNEHVRNHFRIHICVVCDKELIGDAQYEYHITHAHTVKSRNINPAKKSASLRAKDCTKAVATKKSRMVVAASVACGICARIFSSEESAQQHYLKTHTDAHKKFRCDYCGNGFSRKANLLLHIRTHTGVKPFECDQCPKAFANTSGLTSHQRTHTGERPFKCPHCDKHYMHSTDLRRHRRSHGFEEKRFVCGGCNKRFFERKFLNKHQQFHCTGCNEMDDEEKPNESQPLESGVLIEMQVQRQGASGDYLDDPDDEFDEEILA